jgi:serine/threonine protein kinase
MMELSSRCVSVYVSVVLPKSNAACSDIPYRSVTGTLVVATNDRNVLLESKGGSYIAKVADFGLSRNIEDGYYKLNHGVQIPIKWTSIEVLEFAKYSFKSDVWSFGVVLFEIFSGGFFTCSLLHQQIMLRMIYS